MRPLSTSVIKDMFTFFIWTFAIGLTLLGLVLAYLYPTWSPF